MQELKTIKFLEKKLIGNFYNLELDKDFLDKMLKAQEIQGKRYIFYFTKLKTFVLQKTLLMK